jgi:glycine oxidase
VIVIGAGVLGLCSAAELAARGHAVTVIDPGGPNASAIAAGMIAPALESLIDDLPVERAGLLKRARDLWPAFAARHGLILHREGAEWRGPEADDVIARLRALGFAAEPTVEGLFTPDDWRVEPEAALAGLAAQAGVQGASDTAVGVAPTDTGWRVTLASGSSLSTSALVLATGVAAPIDGAPASIATLIAGLQPIRGQLTRLSVAPPSRVIRAPGFYVVPTRGGVLAGATMEAGRRDLAPDARETERQTLAALALLGAAAGDAEARVGVRGATADGLPLAGPSGHAGLHLALAPRRNGWLLGPLVAAVIADGVEGRTPTADAAALDPLRTISPAR